MPLFLVPIEKGRPIILDKAVVFVGRHPSCDVVLTRSRKVSRKHCCIAQVDDMLVVRDLGSMNGVRVNGKRVQKESRLQLGDELAIGDCLYELASEERQVSSENDAPTERAKDDSLSDLPPLNVSHEFPQVVDESGSKPRDAEDDKALRSTPDAIPLMNVDDSGHIVRPEGQPVDGPIDFDSDWIPFEDSGEFHESGSKI